MGDIIVGGKRFAVLGPTKLWTDTGLETTPGRGARKRRRKIDLAVWHWTGGEGTAKTLFRVLNKRGLGVEFFVDHLGVVWQLCDPALVDTFDAGRVNDRSVGTEIANYGYRRRLTDVPTKGKKRARYTCYLNGRKRRFAHFYAPQIAAAISLADTLSVALKIPRAVPTDQSKYWIAPNVLSAVALDAFTGHVGHFHITERKSDPGLDLLESFRGTWACDL